MPLERKMHRRTKGEKLYILRDSQGRFREKGSDKHTLAMERKQRAKTEVVAEQKIEAKKKTRLKD